MKNSYFYDKIWVINKFYNKKMAVEAVIVFLLFRLPYHFNLKYQTQLSSMRLVKMCNLKIIYHINPHDVNVYP